MHATAAGERKCNVFQECDEFQKLTNSTMQCLVNKFQFSHCEMWVIKNQLRTPSEFRCSSMRTRFPSQRLHRAEKSAFLPASQPNCWSESNQQRAGDKKTNPEIQHSRRPNASNCDNDSPFHDRCQRQPPNILKIIVSSMDLCVITCCSCGNFPRCSI